MKIHDNFKRGKLLLQSWREARRQWLSGNDSQELRNEMRNIISCIRENERNHELLCDSVPAKVMKKSIRKHDHSEHQKLCDVAINWLKYNTYKCVLTFSGVKGVGYEEPDVVGWNCSGISFMIEAKTSRSDFLRDKEKFVRKYGAAYGIGLYKYYITNGSFEINDHELEGFGLLVYKDRKVIEVKKPTLSKEYDHHKEIPFLVRCVRIATHGVPFFTFGKSGFMKVHPFSSSENI